MTCFVMYNVNIIICKQGVNTPIPVYIIPVDFFQKNKYVINDCTDEMISTFEAYAYQKMDTLYIIESTRTE